MNSLVHNLGFIEKSNGATAEAHGLLLPLGSICEAVDATGRKILASIIGFNKSNAILMPFDVDIQWMPGSRVLEAGSVSPLRPEEALGKALNGFGQPLNALPSISRQNRLARQPALNPMERRPLSIPMDVGVRCINGLLPVARGQRLGIFAGSGVGKSTLLSMMVKHSKADHVIVALIGERSREVREFVEECLGTFGAERCIAIAVSAGESPLLKIRAAELANSYAEHFRSAGSSCLLIMDSLTRYAMACREIGLAIGEAPASKGYPASAFTKLNALIERAGPGSEAKNEGDITAFYTVLTEGDDLQDPIADNARAILDGHIVLSRKVADSGIYPPIDVSASVSRAANLIASKEQLALGRKYRQLLATFKANEELINAGFYQQGRNPSLDEAIAVQKEMTEYCQQSSSDGVSIQESINELASIFKQ